MSDEAEIDVGILDRCGPSCGRNWTSARHHLACRHMVDHYRTLAADRDRLRADLGEAVAVMKAFLSSYHRVESATDSFPAPFRLHGTTATREAYETMGALLARIEGREEG